MGDFFVEDDVYDEVEEGSAYASEDDTDFSNRELNPYFAESKEEEAKSASSVKEESKSSAIEDDTGAYGEDPEDYKMPEIKGITDEVSGYTYSKMNFPAIFIKSDMHLSAAGFKVLRAMISSTSVADRNIFIYNESSKGVFLIGRISALQVMNFYDLVGQDNIRVFLSSTKELLGDLKYVLCQ